MKHELDYDKRQDVFFVRLIGEISPEDYLELTRFYDRLSEPKPGKILIDITRTKMSTWEAWDRKTREEVNSAVNPFSSATKVALIGANPVSKMLLKVTLNVLGVLKTSRFFKTEDEALQWLKGA